jgi:membrane protein implicated in regulation of membrane protease activity
MRGLGFGIAAFFGWTMGGVLALFVPTLIDWSLTGTFVVFAAIGVVAILYVWRLVPETRGRTLEALEDDVTTGAIHTITKSQQTHAE